MPDNDQLEQYLKQYSCGFEKAQEVFPDQLQRARQVLPPEDLKDYIDGAAFLCKIGVGVEPSLVYLEEMPDIARHIGGAALKIISDYAYQLVRSPNKKALIPFLESLRSVCRRVDTLEDLQHYLEILDDFIKGTETVIHGHHSLYESPGLIPLLEHIPELIGKLTLAGIANFIAYGVRHYQASPEQQRDYFALKTPDARSIMQRERHGVLFKDIERQMDMLRTSLWDCELPFSTFATAFDQAKKPLPYLDDQLIAVPDLLDTYNGISAHNHYRAMLAHMMGHYHWSTQLMADNFAPHMQLFISTFEDARIEVLAMRRYPGLRGYFLPLHPVPPLGDCDAENMACLRYRATRLSRALIDPDFDPEDDVIADFRQQFQQIIANKGEASSTQDMQRLGSAYYVQTRVVSDSYPNVYFDHTEISYRDDNRYMWFHHEESDEPEDYTENEYQPDEANQDESGLPPRFYDEWDYLSESYRPDWVAVYERLQPSANPAKIDALLAKHAGLSKRLKRLVEMLKPQNKRRIRFQEEGEELDLDIALRAYIDYKIGATPDPRVNTSHITESRNISVMLLVDLSNSLNEKVAGTQQTLLELSQEALAIMAWTEEQLGDRFAIAGFHSDTRHEVLYHHIKGYSEHWSDEVKARIAAMEAAYSTRMGAAMRHAAHYLSAQPAEKKLLLVLTDGEPADIDVHDPRMLIEDAAMAVREIDQQGIYSYCINVDPRADAYVADIFGTHYTVIDHPERLPELLPQVFLALTK